MSKSHRHFTGHLPETKSRALELYFKIEQHFALGGAALRLREVMEMIGLRSKSTTLVYVKLLDEWGLINHNPRTISTITLAARPEYPTVVYGTPTDHTEPITMPRR